MTRRDSEQRAEIRNRLTWYLASADAADRALAPQRRHVRLEPLDPTSRPRTFAGPADALKWCESERPNLLAALERAVAHGFDDIAWRLPVALVTFFHLRRYRMDRLCTMLVAVDAARRIQDRFGEAWSLICLGGAYAELRRFDEAIAHYERSEAICREIEDRQGVGMSLVNIGYALLELDRVAEAVDYANQALVIWRDIRDRRNEVITLHVLGDASFDLGRLTEALSIYEQALPIARAVDLDTEGQVLHGIGSVRLRMGRPEGAVDAFKRALTVRRELGDRRGEGLSLHALSRALRDVGEAAASRTALDEALTIFKSLDEPEADWFRAELGD